MTQILADPEIERRLSELHGWERRGNEIMREFSFKNFYQTMAFVNAVAWIAHQQNHHPEMIVSYNRCTIRYCTHSAGGLTENDFKAARAVQGLV